MGSERYRTIDAAPGAGVDVELEVKRSRFLARLRRVATQSAARAVIEERRSHYFDASHHCSAFVLGADRRITRSSDDGEPAGTAGIPMLQVLHQHALSDTVAVVTRYFGGVKLGTGGLARAYGEAVALAVEACGSREVALHQILDIPVPLALAGQLEAQLRGLRLVSAGSITVDDVLWAEQATIKVAVPPGGVAEFAAALAALTSGAAQATPTGQRWIG